jgi:uncharacterized membrane protein YdjX (TVP38/TMEM64 family)
MDKISGSLRRFSWFVFFITAIVIAGILLRVDTQKVDEFLKKIPLGPAAAVFVLLYIAGTFFIWGLKDALKIVGALLFGGIFSTFLIFLSESVNACIFFKLSRNLGRDFVQEKIGTRFKNIYEKAGNLNWPAALVLRANPLIPFRVLDVGFGLSAFSFKKYLAAVLLASFPRILWHQWPLAAVRCLSLEKINYYFLAHPFFLGLEVFYIIFILAATFMVMKKPE